MDSKVGKVLEAATGETLEAVVEKAVSQVRLRPKWVVEDEKKSETWVERIQKVRAEKGLPPLEFEREPQHRINR